MLPGTEALVDLALQEDLAYGDRSSEAVFAPGHRSRAVIRARQALTLCGTEVAARVFERVDSRLKVEPVAADGAALRAGAMVLKVAGSTRSLLAAERTALNFLQHLSGIATQARRYADAAVAIGTGVRITDTRKTTPGWRALEKYAVRCGGCHNHRYSLGEHVMLKDNHLVAAGSVHKAVATARAAAPHLARIEVEADTQKQVEAALKAGANAILLDNMTPAQVRLAVTSIAGRALVEVSGGVGLHNLADYAQPGVDVISIGALTHSAMAVDLGMDFLPRKS